MMKDGMVKRDLFLQILTVSLLFFFGTNFSFAQNDDWPTFHGNLQRTGFSTSTLPAKPQVLWQLTTKDFHRLGINQFEGNRPVISDNKVFIACNQILAFDLKTGESTWQYQDRTPNFYPSGLAVFGKTLIATVNDSSLIKNMRLGFLYALNTETGELLWKQATAGALSHSLPLVVEGKAFVGDDSGTLNALDIKSGQILWQKKLVQDGVIHASPAYEQGLIFIATEGDANYQGRPPMHPSSIFALNAKTGETVWQFAIDYLSNGPNLIHATPAVSQGVVYFGSENGWFYALKSENGQLIWKKQIAKGGEMVGTSAAAGLGYNQVYVSLWSGKFLALDQKTGETRWEFLYEGEGSDSSAVVADNKVCLGAHQGYFYCLEAETGKVLWQEKFGGSSAALAQNILVVPNALAGETLNQSEAPVLIAFSNEGLNLADRNLRRALPITPILLILVGGSGLLLFAFFKLKSKILTFKSFLKG